MKFYHRVRIVTAAPILASGLLIVLGLQRPEIFSGPAQWLLSLLFLGVLPLLGYPLQPYLPYFKTAGRPGQRTLAMLFAALGYLLGCLLLAVTGGTAGCWLVYLEYLLSGIVLLFLNKVCHLTASGHACGAMGPVALLLHFHLYAACIVGLAIAALSIVASKQTRRHTLPQLLGGGLIPWGVLLLLECLL